MKIGLTIKIQRWLDVSLQHWRDAELQTNKISKCNDVVID